MQVVALACARAQPPMFQNDHGTRLRDAFLVRGNRATSVEYPGIP